MSSIMYWIEKEYVVKPQFIVFAGVLKKKDGYGKTVYEGAYIK
jgi:hypothetical protein